MDKRILITGCSGRVGQRLIRAFPSADGLDVSGDPKWRRSVLDGPLPDCDVIVHLAGEANPNLPFGDYSETLLMARHVVSSGKPVVFASSVWADRGPVNAYATVKLAIERMVDLAGGVSVRVGWVGWTPEQYQSGTDWHRSVAWDDDRLITEFKAAVAAV